MTKLYIRTSSGPPYIFEDEKDVIDQLWKKVVNATSHQKCLEINEEIIINGSFIVDAYIDNNAGDS